MVSLATQYFDISRFPMGPHLLHSKTSCLLRIFASCVRKNGGQILRHAQLLGKLLGSSGALLNLVVLRQRRILGKLRESREIPVKF